MVNLTLTNQFIFKFRHKVFVVSTERCDVEKQSFKHDALKIYPFTVNKVMELVVPFSGAVKKSLEMALSKMARLSSSYYGGVR